MARDLGITPSKNQPFYFISYNSDDYEVVKEYAKELERLGVPMWYDGGIRLGDNWEVELVDKIRESLGVIMFLSKNITKKEKSYVLVEFDTITKFTDRKIYFISLDDVDRYTLPSQYVKLWRYADKKQAIKAFEHKSVGECINKLVKDLEYTAFKCAPDGNRRIEFENGDVYEGEFKNGLMHGEGVYRWADGAVYEGEFKDGYRFGKGKYIWGIGSPFEGDVYEGDFRYGERTGVGTYIWGSKSKYAGDKYEGAFYCGAKYGKGVYTFSSGNRYDGSFVDDEMTGKGIFIYKNGNSYGGEFKKDKRHGKGIYHYANGSVYEGEFAEGKMTGYGVLTYPDKSCYEGMLLDGKKNGKGVLKDSKGKIVYKGLFINDKQK